MKNKPKAKCPTCGEVFESQHGMKIHHSSKHDESIAGITVSCSVCGENVTRRPYRVDRDRENFCSPECLEEYNNETQGYEKDELIAEVKRLNEQLEKTPTLADLREHSEITQAVFYRHFDGGWNAALSQADIYEGRNYANVSKQDCLDDLKRTEAKLSRVPTTDDQDECGEVCVKTFYNFFDSWREAVSSAGLDASKVRGRNLPASERKGHPDYGPKWQKQREKALKRDNRRCQRCGIDSESHKEKYGRDLDVHHITPARKYDDYDEQNRLSNLISLCRKCHREYESLPINPQVSEVAE